MVAQEPIVLNALLRCVREDGKAAPLFEPVDRAPGLWVLELGPFDDESWSGWLARGHRTLSANEAFLQALSDGSTDYTLHITVTAETYQAVTLPPSLSLLLGNCGITVELYHCSEVA